MCKLLLELGINYKDENKMNKLAHELAMENNYLECSLLIKHFNPNNKQLENMIISPENLLEDSEPNYPISTNLFKDILVHLDLKGAPPLPEFYERLFLHLQNFHVSGIILEFEDMLPYTGLFKILRNKNAYTKSQIQWICKCATRANLKVYIYIYIIYII